MTNIFINSHTHYQLSREQLRQHIITRRPVSVCNTGALMINTGKFTGRSPGDKFIVKDEQSLSKVDWNNFNQPMSTQNFIRLLNSMIAYMDKRPEIWMRDVLACADLRYKRHFRIINEDPESNFFASNMFIDNQNGDGDNDKWHLLHAPGFEADSNIHGTKNANFTVISFQFKTILIGGSAYTGEIKKSVFTVLNLLLPLENDVLPMHCSASDGVKGVALFFGLSGTGKTTLSADPKRQLIGDDEHGWTEEGIFNLEGGCYAKTINLTKENEPAIYNAIKDGALLENTVFYPGTDQVDYSNGTITENTRVSYPLNHIDNAKQPSIGGHPKNVFFLTCDAYSVLPPISKLTIEQAATYYLNGYTAKVSGTENGIKEPKAVFSPCFGAPFLPLSPSVYADMLARKIDEHKPNVWMVNTGWISGPYGVGNRIDLKYTRAIVNAALNGELDNVEYEFVEDLQLSVPKYCPQVPSEILNPKMTWTNKAAYEQSASELMSQFQRTYQVCS